MSLKDIAVKETVEKLLEQFDPFVDSTNSEVRYDPYYCEKVQLRNSCSCALVLIDFAISEFKSIPALSENLNGATYYGLISFYEDVKKELLHRQRSIE